MDHSSTPPLLGLILSGGRSSRMGSDKSRIAYHQVPQAEWMSRLIRPFCAEVFLSAGANNPLPGKIEVLKDDPIWGTIGPAGGLLTAAALRPEAAWLVAGCDYPYMTSEGIRELVLNRRKDHAAVAFINPETRFPEPLLTVYEPVAIYRLKERLKNGDASLRRLLEDISTVRLLPGSELWVRSVDTPAERDHALATFNGTGRTGSDCR